MASRSGFTLWAHYAVDIHDLFEIKFAEVRRTRKRWLNFPPESEGAKPDLRKQKQ